MYGQHLGGCFCFWCMQDASEVPNKEANEPENFSFYTKTNFTQDNSFWGIPGKTHISGRSEVRVNVNLEAQQCTTDGWKQDLLCDAKCSSMNVNPNRTCNSGVTSISHSVFGDNTTATNLDLTSFNNSDDSDTMDSIRGCSLLYPDFLVASQLDFDITVEIHALFMSPQ